MVEQATDYTAIIEIIEDIFGHFKSHNDYKHQISVDCPVCSHEIKGLDDGDGKGNLEINYSRHVYKCWACGETMGTHGPLGKLFDKFGTKKQKRLYNLIKPDELKQEDAKKVYLKLPAEELFSVVLLQKPDRNLFA